jgi:hypothetical protein
MSLIDRWIVHCADPLGSNADPPPYLPTHFATKLVQQAEAHRVLGAVMRHFPGFKGEGAFAQSYALAVKVGISVAY